MDAFDGMEMFARVVETGGFTRAAEELGVGKSAVSQAVRRLEARLGVQLLERTTRRVSPTEAGRAFHARCRKALDEAAAARAEARALHAEPEGRLKVAAPEAFCSLFVVPMLPALLDAYPKLQIELVEATAPVNLVEAGFDLAIRVTPSPAENLVVRRLGTSRVAIVASPDYLAAWGEPAHPDEIVDHRVVGFTPLYWAREWRFTGEDGPVAVPVRPALLTDHTDTLRHAAVAGVGLAAFPDWLAAADIATGRLRRVLTGWRC
ncbi:MAG TPA: LysR family transcriptional regulator, partial [Caulobacteraceae bacterium]|nr:LysR family transcriptional regulator [Caulobacteraceae bacterium]